MSWAELATALKSLGTGAIRLGRRLGLSALELGTRLTRAAGPACAKSWESISAGVQTGLLKAKALIHAESWRMQRQSAGSGSPGLSSLPLKATRSAGGYNSYAFWESRHLTRRVLDRPLAVAFVLSIVIHLALYGGWRWGKHNGWWEHQATWLLDLTKKVSQKLPSMSLNELVAKPPQEIPLTFVEVDPASASEPPKDANYYGQFNSIAANPEPAIEAKPQPEIDGKQDNLVRVEDNLKPKSEAQPLQPSLPPPEETLPAPEPQKVEPPGDTALQPPEANTVPVGMNEAPRKERPRTLAEARAQKGLLAGEKMKQPGGTRRAGKISLDVKATPFGAYDAAFIAAVQERWFSLIENSRLTQRSGKVVLEFRLSHDGQITDMQLRESEVGELLAMLCQRAVRDPAPYAQWPSDMRRMVGKNYREVLFTFYYY